MTTSTVNGTLVNPAAGALTGAQVTATLVDFTDTAAAGFDTADKTETIDAVAAAPNAATGAWTMQLTPNAAIQLFAGGTQSAYRIVESSAGASSTYWIIVTSASPSWVGDLRTTLVQPGGPTSLPGTWCSVTDVATFTGQPVTQQDVNTAQQMVEALIRRVWRVTDATKRDYYWLQRATAWQALYVSVHPEVLTMMDVSSMSQDGLSIAFRSGASQFQALYAPITLRLLNDLFRATNGTIRYNSAFQKNRLTKIGVTAGSSIPWGNL